MDSVVLVAAAASVVWAAGLFLPPRRNWNVTRKPGRPVSEQGGPGQVWVRQFHDEGDMKR